MARWTEHIPTERGPGNGLVRGLVLTKSEALELVTGLVGILADTKLPGQPAFVPCFLIHHEGDAFHFAINVEKTP
jgi:hypothetical protein